MNKDIEQALTDIRANAARYDKTTRYYDGDHDLAFATEKFQNTFGTLFREFALGQGSGWISEEEALSSAVVTDAAYLSIRTGRWVKVEAPRLAGLKRPWKWKPTTG